MSNSPMDLRLRIWFVVFKNLSKKNIFCFIFIQLSCWVWMSSWHKTGRCWRLDQNSIFQEYGWTRQGNVLKYQCYNFQILYHHGYRTNKQHQIIQLSPSSKALMMISMVNIMISKVICMNTLTCNKLKSLQRWKRRLQEFYNALTNIVEASDWSMKSQNGSYWDVNISTSQCQLCRELYLWVDKYFIKSLYFKNNIKTLDYMQILDVIKHSGGITTGDPGKQGMKLPEHAECNWEKLWNQSSRFAILGMNLPEHAGSKLEFSRADHTEYVCRMKPWRMII